ncbi:MULTISPECIES: uridine kinase family protein [Exiguobacterium]|uniref:uridine kinase family protein n=1 Tax=Exiguobacterium TaxID=33986 RepID=UPI001BE8079D|nr:MULTISPECIES: phosphoribulokinase [Exiguobacterium]MCT4784643.1 phosphoribulokinase [Exiguobacterium himgiriensis]
MNEWIERIVASVQEKETCIVLIAGHGGAGKTTLAHALMERFEEVNYLNTDPYITDSTLRKSTILEYTVDGVTHRYKMTACHPAAHHMLSLERDVRMIREGIGFYTIDVPYLKRTWIDPKKSVTIVEGMSVAFLQPEKEDISIYLYSDGETEFNRRAVRDVTHRGMELDYLKASHEERRIQYEQFMHPYREKFQIILNTSGDEWERM